MLRQKSHLKKTYNILFFELQIVYIMESHNNIAMLLNPIPFDISF